MRIELVRGQLYAGPIDLDAVVAIPVALRNHVRIVRVGHRYDQAERPAILAAGHVEELAAGMKDDLVVEVDLIRASAGSRLRDRVHAVIPARPLLEARPIGRPAEIGGVDVGRQALLEAVQLIGPAEVHFPAEHGLVAGAPQIMCESGHLRGKLGGIVVCTDGRHLAPRQERKA